MITMGRSSGSYPGTAVAWANNYNGTLFRVLPVTAVVWAINYSGALFRVYAAIAVASANDYNGTLFTVYQATAVAWADNYNWALFGVLPATAVASASDSSETLFRVHPAGEARNLACVHFWCGKCKITTLKMKKIGGWKLSRMEAEKNGLGDIPVVNAVI
jgi:hypothetical protein